MSRSDPPPRRADFRALEARVRALEKRVAVLARLLERHVRETARLLGGKRSK